ncbi:MAG: hypothetical protein WD077_00715 [Bacteroidia bacterium]
MKKLNFKKDILPHLLVVLGFILLSYIYFLPVISGKVLSQHDIKQWRGAYHQMEEFNKETGEKTLWTNAMFSGMPAYQIYLPYEKDLWGIKYIQIALIKTFPSPVNSLFLYMLGFYLLLLSLRVNKWVAAICAIAFCFSSYNLIIIEAGHITKSYAIAFAPFVLAGILFTLRSPHKIIGASLTGIALAIQIKTNHIQITYYLFLVTMIIGIVELIYAYKREEIVDFLKSVGFLVVAAGLGALANFTNLAVTEEYGAETIRGTSELTQEDSRDVAALDWEYAMEYSYGIAETFNLIIPNFMGGASSSALSRKSATYEFLRQQNVPNANNIIEQLPTYWGPQRITSGPVYIGAVMIFFFVLGLFLIKGPVKWWVVIATILAILLAWGKHFETFNSLMFKYLPLYNKFRAVSMALVIVQLTVPLMGALALNELYYKRHSTKEFIKYLKYSVYIVGGIILFFALLGGTLLDFTTARDAQLPEWLAKTIVEDRASMLSRDAWRALFFVVAAAAAAWAYIADKLNMKMAFAAIGLLATVDLWMVDKRYFSDDDFITERKQTQEFTKTAADERILQDDSKHYRVLNLTTSPFNDAVTSYWHNSVGGYHGAKLLRYQEFIERAISPDIQKINESGFQNTSALNMLNTKYIITGQTAEGVVQNNNTLGAAWYVDDLIWAENADEEIAAIQTIDPANTAVIDKRFNNVVDQGFDPEPGPTSNINLETYHHNYIKYTSNNTAPQFAVFSEVYYNSDIGWQAYLNGEKVPHARVNYILRGMTIPAGEHTIEFKFEPQTVEIAGNVAMASSIALLLFLLVGIGIEFKKAKT